MKEITQENFEQEVAKAGVPVLVDFNADWCGPCKAMAATLEPLAEKAEGFEIVSINIDEQPELAERYEVMSIPCLVVMKNGEEVAREVGVQSEKRILKMLEKAK